MGFSAGRTTVSTTVAIQATIPAPGSAIGNTLRDRVANPAGGATQTLPYGTSIGQADVFCDGEYAIAAGASLTLNFYDGGTTVNDLTTSFGVAANLRVVRSVVVGVKPETGGTSGVTVGGAAANEWVGFFGAAGDTAVIFPDGPALAMGSPAGVAVTSTTKNLKLLNNSSTAPVTVQVFVSGGILTVGTVMGAFPMVVTYS